MDEGTTKNAICRSPRFSRRRRYAADLAFVAHRARHGRQFRRRDRHAEQAHRQRVEHLRVRQAGHGAGGQQARQQRVDIRAHLHHAAADEHRARSCGSRCAHFRDAVLERKPQALHQAQHPRQLHAELQAAADYRSPRQQDRQPVQIHARAEPSTSVRDHGDVPDHRRRIGEEEAAVAVENRPGTRPTITSSPTPGNRIAHQADGELALCPP